MNTYEVLFIFKPILDVDNSDNVLQTIEENIQSLKGKVVRKDKLGRKRLAYEILKFKDGFITSMIMQMDPAAVKEFKRTCQMNEDVLRMTMLRQDKFDLNNLPEVPDVRTERPERREREERGPRRGPNPRFAR